MRKGGEVAREHFKEQAQQMSDMRQELSKVAGLIDSGVDPFYDNDVDMSGRFLCVGPRQVIASCGTSRRTLLVRYLPREINLKISYRK